MHINLGISGDVFTLINVVDMLNFIQNHHYELILVPYLNVETWKRYVKQITKGKDARFEVDHMIRLLRDKYSYATLKQDN